MPPKKKEEEKKVLLGRPGNSLKSGIVCRQPLTLPSVRVTNRNLRSVSRTSVNRLCSRPSPSPVLVTLPYVCSLLSNFSRRTLISSQNFPYATIDPEEARIVVPDERFDWLVSQYKPKSVVPANLTIYDIAGLTRGASTGAGLGNAFLSHIRAVDAIYQVVRCFDDAEIIHVEGDVDPVRDLDIISEELRIKDIEFVEKGLENLKKQTKRGGQSLEVKKLKEEEATVEKILQWLKDGKDVRNGNWSPKEVNSSPVSPSSHLIMMIKSDCSIIPAL